MRSLLLCLAVGAGCTSTAASQPPPDEAVAPPPTRRPVMPEDGEMAPIFGDDYGHLGLAPGAPKLGDTAPDFRLPTSDGAEFSLSEARASGPVLLLFYRGFW